MGYKVDTLYVDEAVKETPLAYELISIWDDSSKVFGVREELEKTLLGLSIPQGKKTIFLTESKGKLVKLCPGMTEPYLCCKLYVINPISNCPQNCSYCFLQFYLNMPATVIYTDWEKAKEEVTELTRKDPNHLFRFTTGELSDSLAFDRETKTAEKLIAFFRNVPNGLLELKTKTTFVDHILEVEHGGRTVISWSINTPRVIKKEEKGAPSLEKRLKVAQKCQEQGFLLGFHFDPLIYYPRWEDDYKKTVKALFSIIDPKKIAWISLGTLRFRPGMEEAIKIYFPESKLPYGELIKAKDGKMRYVKPIRHKMYKKVLNWIKEYGGEDIFVYLCMELPGAWEEVMDYAPKSKEELDQIFANQLRGRKLL